MGNRGNNDVEDSKGKHVKKWISKQVTGGRCK